MEDTLRTIVSGKVTDAIFGSSGSDLYVSRGNTITAYAAASGATLASWTVGTDLGAMDVTEDGRYLIALERAVDVGTDPFPNGRAISVYAIDLTTSAIRTYTTTTSFFTQRGFFDVVAVSGTEVVLTQDTDRDMFSPVSKLDLVSGAFQRPPTQELSSATLISSHDHSAFLWSGSRNGVSSVRVLNDDGTFGVSASYSANAQAISSSGMVAIYAAANSGGLPQLHIFDRDLNLLASPGQDIARETAPGFFNGLAFSPDGSTLYALNGRLGHVFAIDMGDYSVDAIYSVDASADQQPTDSVFGDRISVSHDGRYLSVVADDKLQLVDLARPNALMGDDSADTLTGTAARDGLYGKGGDDRLDGGAGADTMVGGTGNDTYVVDDLGDMVVEQFDGGTDTIITSIALSPPANVERLELAAGARASLSAGGQGTTLIGNDLGTSFVGQTGNDIIRALGGDDRLFGIDGSDLLDGGEGNDVLQGGSGNDILTGGAGADTFADPSFNLNGDTINDFTAEDRIVVLDAKLADFAFSLNGSTLNFTGGSLTLATVPQGTLVARAAAQGGVEIVVGAAASTDPRNDFNGDGRSDILWRNVGGAMSDWLGRADGGFTVNDGAALSQVGTEWRIAGTADLNGDGRDDVLWRNADGTLSNWLARADGGFTQNDANGLRQVGNDWQVAGTGDFDGDGHDDVLWRHADGRLSDWLGTQAGGYVVNDGAAATSAPTGWQVAGTGDFNGDERDDILWRSADGRLSDWLARGDGGFTPNDAAALTRIGNEWQVAGTGDFNGDGRDDILWRSADGSLSNWLGQANGGFAQNDANAFVSQVSLGWSVADTGDYNGDGRDDILWRSAEGQVSDWLANAAGGFVVNDAAALVPVSTDWFVA